MIKKNNLIIFSFLAVFWLFLPVLSLPFASASAQENRLHLERATIQVQTAKHDFGTGETPEFTLIKTEAYPTWWQKLTNQINDWLKHSNPAADTPLNITLKNAKGEVVNEFTNRVSNPQQQLAIKPSRFDSKPGAYTITLKHPSTDRDLTQDFTWGVLAVNTNKSIYLPGETAKLAMAVLDDTGNMVCDAKLTLNISPYLPNLPNTTLSTADGSIIVNPECHQHRVTSKPDYEASYQIPDQTGRYLMTLTAETANGTRTLKDNFEVHQSVAFDIERVTATRIYPDYQYPVTIKVTPNQDFAGTVTETVPASFKLEPDKLTVKQVDIKHQAIVWDVNWQAGQTYELTYSYDAPDVSPEFFLIEPLQLKDRDGMLIFAEIRPWQIAADAIGIGTVQSVLVSNTTPYDIQNVTISGSNRYLLVAVLFDNNNLQNVTSVVLDPGGGNETSLTHLDNAVVTTNDDGHGTMWGVVAPPIGTFNIRVTLSGGGVDALDDFTAGAWPLTGVDQANPRGTVATNSGSSATPNVTVSSGSNEIVFGGAWIEDKTNLDYTGPGVTDWDLVDQSSSVGAHEDGASPNVTLNWSVTADVWVAIGVSIKPAAAGFDVSGTFHGTSESGGDPGQCDGATQNLSLRVNTGDAVITSCADSSGIFTFTGVSASANDTITIYSTGVDKANRVYVSDGSADTGMNLYEDTVIVADENDAIVTIPDLWDYDSTTDDTNMLFNAVDSTPDTLTTESGIELHIWTGDTLDPGGTVTTTGTSGDLHVDDSAVIYLDTSTNTLAGPVTVDTGATLNLDASVNFGGSLTSTGTTQASTGTHTFTAGGTISGGGTINFYDLATSTTGTTTISSAVSTDSDVSVGTGTTLKINADLAVNGGALTTVTNGIVTYDSGTPTVTIAGAGNIGVSGGSGAITFYNLTANGSSQTTTLQQNITVAHALSVGASHVFAMGTTSPTIGSNSISDSGDITIASGASTSHTSGTVTILNTTNAADWSGPGTFTVNNLTIGNGSAMTVDNETSDLPLDVNNNFTISASATFQASSTAAFNVGGSWSNNATGVFTSNTGTVTFDATTGTPTITSAGDPFYTVVLNDAGNNITFTLEDAFNVNGDLTITGGTLDTKSAESNSINIEGTWTNNDLFEANTSVVTFDGDSGTPTIKTNGAASAFYDLTFNDGAAEITWTLSDALYVDRNLTITDATLNTGSNYGVFVGGSAGGTWSNSDTFEANSSTVTFQATGGSPTITTGGSASAFYNLVFNDAAGEVTFALSDQLYVDNNLTITDATLNSNGQNITVGGSWTNDDIFTEGTATVTFTTASAATIDSNCTTVSSCTNENFYNLVINKTSSTDTVTLTNFGIRVTGTLTITTGTLVQGAYNIQAEGATAISVGSNGTLSNTSTGDISLAGNVSNSGTVTLKANNNCGSTNDIAITAVSGTPSWSGGGTYTLYDVSVTGQNAAVAITVNSGTNGGSNTGSWTFSDSCPAGATHTNSHFSLSIWLNPTTSIATKAIMVEDFEIRLVTDGSGNPLCQISNSVSWQTAATSSTALTTSSWQHVACTYDQQSLRVFVNGELTGSQNLTVAIDDTANSWRFGDDEGATYGDYSGKMDDVRLYNRALSPAEVSRLYNWAPGPVGEWKMDENTGTTAYDTSASSVTNNGTLTSNPAWAPGKFGSGIKLIPGSYVNVPDNDDSIDFTVTDSFTWSAWINSSDWASDPILYNNYGSGNPGYRLRTTSAGKPACAIHDGTAGPETIANTDIRDGNWHFLTCIRNVATDTIYVYIDGVLENSTNDTTTGTLVNTTAFTIGRSSNTSTGIVDDARIYNYARTPGQIIEDMNAGHPAPGSPIGSAVAHWKFDEGADNTCSGGSNDACNSGSVGNTLDVANSGASWSNSGKFGKALSFDGTNDSAQAADNDSIDFNYDQNFTVSTWVKIPTSQTDTDNTDNMIVEKWSGTNGYPYVIRFNNSTHSTNPNKIYVSRYDGTNNPTITSASTYNDNLWHNIVFTKNSSTLSLYIDGKLIDTTTDTTTTTTTNTSPLYFGFRGGSTNYFTGVIDETKIFNFALTSDQVKVLYNQSSTSVWGAVSTDASNNPSWSANDSYCPPGQGSSCTAPVAEWKMDENTGTTAQDTSGNGNTGTITSAAWTTGKKGSALNFDGTNSYVTASGPAFGTAGTIEFWAYPNFDPTAAASNWKYVFDSTDGHRYIFAKKDTANYWSFYIDSTIVCTDCLSGLMTGYQWNYIALTWDNSLSTNREKIYANGVLFAQYNVSITNATPTNLWIGQKYSGSAERWNGKIDDVKIYNYARTQAQIAWDYNRGKPVGWWKMDDNISGDGQTIRDSSGNGNDGTTEWGTNASGMDCTVAGKRNLSCDFDGTDDYLQVPSDTSFQISGDLTLSAWFNTTNVGAGNRHILKLQTSGGALIYQITQSGDDIFAGFSLTGGNIYPTKNNILSASTWYHVAAVINGSTGKLYLNGVEVDSINGSGTMQTTAQPLYIGSQAGTSLFFNGQIDEVKIFNYALTPQQIKTVYNDGAVSFIPLTGTP